MQHFGSSNEAENVSTSPLIRFHTNDQKLAHTKTFSVAAPGRRETSLVGFLSHVSFFQPLLPLWKLGWTAEVLSCIFALLSLLGLIATLIAHQNKPLPQWPQLVSLNSIVSLFSLFIRAGVGVVLAEGISQSKWMWYRKARKLDDMERFDTASRGAFGSFLLLINLGPRRPHWIAAFGALLTIMSAFTGFASQQLLQFNDCLQPDNAARVEIARANSLYLADPTKISFRVASIAEPLQVAIDVGLIQPVQDLTAVLSSGCITGNCTFPATENASFSSLGFGHSCEDVTSQIIKIPTNETFAIGGHSNQTALAYWANLTRPDGSPFGRTGFKVGANWGGMATGAYNGEVLGAISVIQMIFRRGLYDFNHTAYSCKIFPTINTYKVSINTAILREDLVESLPIGLNMMHQVTKEMDDGGTQFKRATSSVLRNGVREDCIRRDTPSDGFVVVAEANIDAALINNATHPDDVAKRIWYYPKDCIWRVGLGTASGIALYFQTVFTGQTMMYEKGVGSEGSMPLLRLFQQGNMTLETVNESMANLTSSMTTAARTLGTDNTPANGTMWYNTTCLGINWPWITFDAGMIVLCAIFLVLVSIESRGVESERLWKSSVLATLFCEIEDPMTKVGKPVRIKDMETLAQSTSVSLDPSSRTLKLVTR